MKMNRRNALLGIGAIATGGGALFGSGAFSQVEADRTVDVSLADDSSANLALKNGTGATSIIGSTTADGQSTIEFSESNLNADAKTTWNAALEVKNKGDQSVTLTASQTGGTGGSGNVFQLQYGGGPSNLIDNGTSLSANGGTVVLDIVIDLTNGNETDIPSTVTFTATA